MVKFTEKSGSRSVLRVRKSERPEVRKKVRAVGEVRGECLYFEEQVSPGREYKYKSGVGSQKSEVNSLESGV